jgi:hypothetical protein
VKSCHEKTKKNQLPPIVINPKVIEVFEDWIVKGWGGARNAETAIVFSLAHVCTTRERERARGRQFVFCMMQQ